MSKKTSGKNVTIWINPEIYSNYRRICEEEGLALSRRIELFMRGEIAKRSSLSEKNQNNSNLKIIERKYKIKTTKERVL